MKTTTSNLNENIFFRKQFYAIALIIISACIVYFNSMKVPFVFDDVLFIQNNLDIRSLDNIWTKFVKYDRPLTYITFAVNYRFGKLNVTGYHAFNLATHILTAIFVFLVAKKTIFHACNRNSSFFPFLASILFVVHPVNIETVTSVYNRSTSMAAMFFLMSLFFFLKTFDSDRKYFLLCIFSFIFSMLSKQTAVTLPVLVLLFDFIFLSGYKYEGIFKRRYYHAALWALLFAAAFAQLAGQKVAETSEPGRLWEGFSYYYTQPWVITKFLQLLVFPAGLAINHKIEPVRTLTEARFVLPVILLIFIIIAACRLYRRKTAASKIILFSIAWFFITLIPTTLFKVHIGERHIYLPSFGFYLAVISIYFVIFKKEFYSNFAGSLLLIVAFHATILGITTVKRNNIFHNPLLLYQDNISKYPNDAKAYNNLGDAFYSRKDYDNAILNYTAAIAIAKDFYKAYNNRGNAYADMGETGKALADFDAAIGIKPDYAEAYCNRANVYSDIKQYDRALADYGNAINLKPGFPEAYYNRAVVYYETGKYERSWDDIHKLQEFNFDINQGFIELLKKASGRQF